MNESFDIDDMDNAINMETHSKHAIGKQSKTYMDVTRYAAAHEIDIYLIDRYGHYKDIKEYTDEDFSDIRYVRVAMEDKSVCFERGCNDNMEYDMDWYQAMSHAQELFDRIGNMVLRGRLIKKEEILFIKKHIEVFDGIAALLGMEEFNMEWRYWCYDDCDHEYAELYAFGSTWPHEKCEHYGAGPDDFIDVFPVYDIEINLERK